MRITRFYLLAVMVAALFAGQSHAQGLRYVTRRAVVAPNPQYNFPGVAPAPNAAPGPAAMVAAPVVARPATRVAYPVVVDAGKRAETVAKIVEFQRKRAFEGGVLAQYDLGIRYLNGDGVEKDEATARKWLRLAADNGEPLAQKKLRELDGAK